MSYFEQFVTTIKKGNTARGLALLAGVTVGALTHLDKVPGDNPAPIPHSSVQKSFTGSDLSLSYGQVPTPKEIVQSMQKEAEQYVQFSQTFVYGLHDFQKLSDTLNDGSISDRQKYDKLWNDLQNNVSAFYSVTSGIYPELNIVFDPDAKKALSSIEGLSGKVDQVQTTLDRVDEALKNLSNSLITQDGKLVTDKQFQALVTDTFDKIGNDSLVVASTNFDNP